MIPDLNAWRQRRGQPSPCPPYGNQYSYSRNPTSTDVNLLHWLYMRVGKDNIQPMENG